VRTGQVEQLTATGDVTTASSGLFAVSLTGGSDAATLTVKVGGSSGTTVLVLKAAANTSVVYPLGAVVPCPGGIHATLAGTSPSATFVYE
jgi:hypothetical protein